jgi:hypothetical protein
MKIEKSVKERVKIDKTPYIKLHLDISEGVITRNITRKL